MNFRFSSSNKAEITESRTFCTHAPCWPNHPTVKHSQTVQLSPKHQKEITLHRRSKDYPNRVVGADVVLINRLQPTNIVVRVRHQMDIDFSRHDAPGGVVIYVAGLRKWNSHQKNGKEHRDLHYRCSPELKKSPEMKIRNKEKTSRKKGVASFLCVCLVASDGRLL